MLVLEFRPYKRIDREKIDRWLEITDKEDQILLNITSLPFD